MVVFSDDVIDARAACKTSASEGSILFPRPVTTLTLHGGLQRLPIEGVLHIRPPKTESGVRTIAIPPGLVDLIRAQTIRVKEAALKFGPHYQRERMFLFAGPGGAPQPPVAISRRVKKLLEAAGIDGASTAPPSLAMAGATRWRRSLTTPGSIRKTLLGSARTCEGADHDRPRCPPGQEKGRRGGEASRKACEARRNLLVWATAGQLQRRWRRQKTLCDRRKQERKKRKFIPCVRHLTPKRRATTADQKRTTNIT